MFCVLSQNYHQLFFGKIINASYSKLSTKLKNGIEILSRESGFKIMDQNSQNIILIKLTLYQEEVEELKDRLVYLNFNSIFEFLGQFTIRCIYYFL